MPGIGKTAVIIMLCTILLVTVITAVVLGIELFSTSREYNGVFVCYII